VAGHRLLLVDLRQRVEVVAQVAAGGEEGRPAVLVAAVAGDPLRAGEGRSEQRAVFVVEREVEDLQVVATARRARRARRGVAPRGLMTPATEGQGCRVAGAAR